MGFVDPDPMHRHGGHLGAWSPRWTHGDSLGTDRHCRGPRRARLLAAALAARDFSLATPHPDGRGEPHRLSPQRVVKVNGSRGRCIRASAIGASAHPPVPTARRAQPRDKQRTEVRRAGRHAHAGWRRLSFRFRTRWRQRCEPTLPCFRRYRDGSALPTAAPRTLQRLGGTPPGSAGPVPTGVPSGVQACRRCSNAPQRSPAPSGPAPRPGGSGRVRSRSVVSGAQRPRAWAAIRRRVASWCGAQRSSKRTRSWSTNR